MLLKFFIISRILCTFWSPVPSGSVAIITTGGVIERIAHPCVFNFVVPIIQSQTNVEVSSNSDLFTFLATYKSLDDVSFSNVSITVVNRVDPAACRGGAQKCILPALAEAFMSQAGPFQLIPGFFFATASPFSAANAGVPGAVRAAER